LNLPRKLGLALALSLGLHACSRPAEPLPAFHELVEELSEEGGYFDTDNLISNETAYVQVVDELEPAGGVYIGVGPEQNFHYIGRLRPSWAFIVDIRRDNMLHHFLLNAVLVNAEHPYDYLCWLFSRRCEPRAAPRSSEIDAVVAAVEAAPPDETVFVDHLENVLEQVRGRLGVPLSDDDASIIEFIYRSYYEGQLGLRFRSYGRRPMPYHPTYRSLLLARSPDGGTSHFLSREGDYAHVRDLAVTGHLVPVVGDFAGGHALRSIARFIESRGETVSAFYVSNVEFYLFRNGQFPAYVENVRALPRSDESLFIRAYFDYGYPHPAALPGHRSTLVRQKMNRFLDLYDRGAYTGYWDVSTLDYER